MGKGFILLFFLSVQASAVMLCDPKDRGTLLPGAISLYNQIDFEKGFMCKGMSGSQIKMEFGKFIAGKEHFVGQTTKLGNRNRDYQLTTERGLNRIICPKNVKTPGAVLNSAIADCEFQIKEVSYRNFFFRGTLTIFASNPLNDSQSSVTYRGRVVFADRDYGQHEVECTFSLVEG